MSWLNWYIQQRTVWRARRAQRRELRQIEALGSTRAGIIKRLELIGVPRADPVARVQATRQALRRVK